MFHHINRHKHLLLHHKWNPEIIEYYVYLILRTTAFSLVLLFLPIFLYVDLNYSLFQITIFYLINQFYFVLSVPFSGFIIKKLGIKHSIFLHLPFLALFWFLLRYLSGNFVSDLPFIFLLLFIRVVPKSALGGAEVLFTYHNVLKKKHYGKSLANLRIALIISTILAPLIGGLIAKLFGFTAFFNVAIGILLLSGIPLFLTKDKYFKIKYKSREFINFASHKISKDFIMARAGLAIPDVVIWILWPIFIYLVVKSTSELGAIVSISSLVAILIVYLIGKEMDKNKSNKILKKTTYFASIVFFFRVIFMNPLSIMITDALNKIIWPSLFVSYDKYFYEYFNKAKDKLKTAIATSFIYEVWMFIFIIPLVILFGLLEFFKISVTHEMFVIIFILFGLPILLIPKITKTVNLN